MAIDLEKEFEKYQDEFLEFGRIEAPAHPCPDVCAFMLLSELVPIDRGRDMIVAATHGEFWLRTDVEKLAEAATSEDIRTLVRCGVRYDADTESLCMFT